MARFIVVRNWDEYQHYKDRNPPWIKLYRDTLSSEAWVMGTDISRLMQLAITLLAARYSNKTPLHFPLLRKVASLDCSEQAFMDAVAHLCAHEFLDIQDIEEGKDVVASTTLAKCAAPSAVLYSEESREEVEQKRGESERARGNDSNALASGNGEPKGGFTCAANAPHVPHGTLTRDFETWAQRTYPECTGQRNWTTAIHNAGVLITTGRATEELLRERITGYRAFVDSGGVGGPQYVRTPQNFLVLHGEDQPWQRPWAAVKTKADLQRDEREQQERARFARVETYRASIGCSLSLRVGETPEVFETRVKCWERDNVRGEPGVQKFVTGLVAQKRVGG